MEHECNNDDKLKYMEEEIKSLKEKIAELWSMIMNHDKTIAVIETKLNNITEKIDSVIGKIDKLAKNQELYDKKPAELNDKLKIAILTGIIMLVVGYFFRQMTGV